MKWGIWCCAWTACEAEPTSVDDYCSILLFQTDSSATEDIRTCQMCVFVVRSEGGGSSDGREEWSNMVQLIRDYFSNTHMQTRAHTQYCHSVYTHTPTLEYYKPIYTRLPNPTHPYTRPHPSTHTPAHKQTHARRNKYPPTYTDTHQKRNLK